MDQVSIGIKTFLRDAHLFHAVEGIERNLPGVKMIIADDGRVTDQKLDLYERLKRDGHTVLLMPFDSGFGKKSNAITSVLDRTYLLVGSDDFNFDEVACDGIRHLVNVAEYSSYDILSGRVNNREYESILQTKWTSQSTVEVEEVPVKSDAEVVSCDLTVNYSLIHKNAFRYLGWDDDVKIGGGEHGAFFFDARLNNIGVGYVKDVNIYEYRGAFTSWEYKQYRARARSKERPAFVKRGITKWTLRNGVVDYEAPSGS